ncbi:MAG: glycosyltransferase [Lachnospiraceae bacterium]|nr:glycosyltransferase [Lachnospiraceae bacterium]
METLKKGISAVLLAYGEGENLKVLIPMIKEKLEATGEAYEVVVVDGPKQTDDSAGICSENGARYYNQELPGFAEAFKKGIREAAYRTFLILDADMSHDPKYIPDIYSKFVGEKADVVIGSRYVKGGVSNDAFTSKVMSHILNTVYGVVLGIKAKDMSTDYRMYRTVRLKRVVDKLKCKNYDVLQEVLLYLKLDKQDEEKRFRVREVPITFEKRMYGESKRQLVKFIISYMKSVIYLTGVRLKHKRS